MFWGDKRYNALNYDLRQRFGAKVIKLSLDGGFTCPNRDGTIGKRGCIFCGERGSGEFTAYGVPDISLQIEKQKQILSKKWKAQKFIAYFQSYTNTYAPVQELNRKYREAMTAEGIVGLAVATRPDCLPTPVLKLLEDINKKTFLWVELGLQTIHPRSAQFIRRGYELPCFEKAVAELKKRNIKTVVHLIAGLPGESKENFLETVRYTADMKLYGVKIHLLYVLKGTDLYDLYLSDPFVLLTKDQYIKAVTDALELLPPRTVIHRLTGDGPRKLLAAPLWSLDKKAVLTGIDNELTRRNSYQGLKFEA